MKEIYTRLYRAYVQFAVISLLMAVFLYTFSYLPKGWIAWKITGLTTLSVLLVGSLVQLSRIETDWRHLLYCDDRWAVETYRTFRQSCWVLIAFGFFRNLDLGELSIYPLIALLLVGVFFLCGWRVYRSNKNRPELPDGNPVADVYCWGKDYNWLLDQLDNGATFLVCFSIGEGPDILGYLKRIGAGDKSTYLIWNHAYRKILWSFKEGNGQSFADRCQALNIKYVI